MVNKVYDLITNQIIESLNEGIIPWEKPYHINGFKNIISGKSYRGINVLLLGLQPRKSSYWLTYKQAEKLGGNVRRGEKASLCVFYKLWSPDGDNNDDEETTNKIPLLRYYKVFNLDQCEGIEAPEKEFIRDNNPIEECERIVANMPNKPKIEHINFTPHYSPSEDTVRVVIREKCISSEEYYSTLFHELAHSTAHISRLDRKLSSKKERDDYSFEELVAEICAGFLCAITGIENKTLKNSTAYCQGWSKALKKDKTLVVKAAAAAMKAADYIQGIGTEATAKEAIA